MIGQQRLRVVSLLIAFCWTSAVLPSTRGSDVEYFDQEVDELEQLNGYAQEDDDSGNSIGRDARINQRESQNRCHYVCDAGISIGANVRKIICQPPNGQTTEKVLEGSCCPEHGMKQCTHHRQEVCRKNLTWGITGKDCGYKKCTVKQRRKSQPEVKKFIAHRTKVCFFKLTPLALIDGGLGQLVSRRQGRHPHCCRKCYDGKWGEAICTYKKRTG